MWNFTSRTLRTSAARTLRPSLVSNKFNCCQYGRHFSVSAMQRLAVADMTEKDFAGLQIDQSRLMNDIHSTAEWGKGERWGELTAENYSGKTEIGMSRLSLSDDDKKVRDWFAQTAESLGCKVTFDEMGNQYAIRPGKKEGLATFAGSHLDTQPTGGRYDGVLGVCAGLEMLKTLNDNSIETTYPVGVVNWTNEEGARFPMSMVSSGVWAGSIPVSKAHALKSVIPSTDTATMKSELSRIGYLGSTPASHTAHPMAAHFELHIEQGPILEGESRRIGVVRGVQSYKWFTVGVRGRDAHTGATTFPHRADALLTASKLILASHRIAHRHGALASTGILTLRPGSTNTVPGFVRFSLDVRSPRDEVVEAVEAECRAAFGRIAAGEDVEGVNAGCAPSERSCSVEWRTDTVSAATHFHEDCIRCVTEAGKALCGSEGERVEGQDLGSWGKLMTSGAGHDSVFTSKRCPATMIFVPCREGISHNPAEYSSPEACADGANVLTGAVLRYDKLRSERGE